MNKTILVLCLLMSAVTVYGREKKSGQSNEKSAIELETIWEKQFDEPVVDVIFDEAEMTVKEAKQRGWKNLKGKKDDEKVALPNPKVKFNEKEIIFLDDKGKIRRKMDISYQDMFKFKKSKNEKFIGVKTISKIERSEKGIKNVDAKFAMLNTDGAILWEANKYFYDFIPSPDGRYVIEIPDVEWANGPLTIHNAKGLVKEISKPSRGFSIDFSENGEHIALTLNDRKEKKGYVVLLDKNGNELWRKELETSVGSVSMLNNFISCTSSNHSATEIFSNHFYLFAIEGNLITKIPIKPIGDYEAIFSKDETMVLTVGSASHIFLYNIVDKKILWEYRNDLIDEELRWGRGDRKGRFRGFAASPYFSFIAVTDPGYGKREDYLYLFNKAGENILTEKLGIGELWREKFYPYRPQVKLSSREPKIFVKTKSGIKIFKHNFTSRDRK